MQSVKETRSQYESAEAVAYVSVRQGQIWWAKYKLYIFDMWAQFSALSQTSYTASSTM